jgi:hypothetical protein
MIIDANGSVLTPAMLRYAWCQIPDARLKGARTLLSRRNYDALLRKITFLTPGLLDDRALMDGIIPIYDSPHVQDDAVFIYSEDFLHQLVMIKNLKVPKEPEDAVSN